MLPPSLNLWRNEDGQGMTEYALIISLVAIAAMATVMTFRDQIRALFTSVSDSIDNAPMH